MSAHGHDDGGGPELDALIAVLRGAAPSGDELAALRASVVGAMPPPRGGGAGGAWGGWLLIGALALLGTATYGASREAQGDEAAADVAHSGAPLARDAPMGLAAAAPSARAEIVHASDAAPSAGAEAAHATIAITAPSSSVDPSARQARSPRSGPPRAASSDPAPAPAPLPRVAPAASPLDAVRVVAAPPLVGAAVAMPGLDLALFAQDADLGVAGAPSRAAPPSALYAGALRAYAASRCEEAIVPLQRVVEGETADAPVHVERAELVLGECLLRLGYVHSAFVVLDVIARRGEEHSQHGEALAPLGRVGERAADPAVAIEAIGRYSEDRLVRFERTPLGDTLAFLMARARYAEADFDAAARLFARVSAGSRWYVPARYWEGVTHVRRRRARPATEAFRAVIDAVGTARDGGSGERERYRDLAWIALARVTYSAAAPGRRDADAARQTQLLTSALDAWQRVPFGSEHGLDAFFEESWALYVLGEHERALGHVHGLLAPQFEERVFPEAYVLRATAYFEHCRYGAAETAIADFHRRYDALLTAIARRERAVDDPAAAHALLEQVRSGRGPGGLEGTVLRSAFEDRDIARQMIQVRSIDAEIARVDAARAPLAGSTLALRLAQDLAVLRALAVSRAGESVRARVRRIGDDLRERANEIDTVQLEIETARRRALESGAPLTTGPERPVAVVAVQGDQLWPFDGEYWEDELPYFREMITSICAR